jgi:hypothetical protein
MKLSKCLLLTALSLSTTGYAQTSQTYHFGEGQTTLQRGQNTSPPPLPGAERTQPLPPGEPHTQAKPKKKSHPKSKSKAKSHSKHKQHHRHTTTHRSPLQDPYSHP